MTMPHCLQVRVSGFPFFERPAEHGVPTIVMTYGRRGLPSPRMKRLMVPRLQPSWRVRSRIEASRMSSLVRECSSRLCMRRRRWLLTCRSAGVGRCYPFFKIKQECVCTHLIYAVIDNGSPRLALVFLYKGNIKTPGFLVFIGLPHHGHAKTILESC
ncbi:TPA_asm: hypothetical protein [Powellomyces chytrid fungus MELD virus 3]|nr:TPA_asm: hypothetical protein [Powellomyces chytrid fungus MELD virus 3]